MKKLIVFLILVFVNLCGFARNDVLPLTDEVLGDTMVISNTSVCNGVTKTLSIPSFLGFQTSCSYSCNGVSYYTTDPHIVLTFNVPRDTTFMCYIDSVNGELLNPTMAIAITVNVPHAITIPQDSIKHVTCPDGALWTHCRDGSFHVDLVDSVQEYLCIHAHGQYYYDAFTVEGLGAGTYQIEAYATNGCVYRDSVIIEQPEAWGWDPEYRRIDTVCSGETGCMSIDLIGGTPPYSFTWLYYDENEVDTICVDTTRLVCGLYSGKYYHVIIYDSRGCKARGEEIEYFLCYLYEYVEDSTHIITTDPMACYGSESTIQAQSMGYGSYTWHVGEVVDSVNYSTWVEADSVLIAEYHTPAMTEPGWVSVDFADQHGCVTYDSVWVEVNHPEVDLDNTPDNLCSNGDDPLDLAAYTATNPAGGTLYYYGAAGLSWNGQFTLASAGSYEIHAIYTDPDGCTGQDSTTIHVMDPEPIVLTVDTLMFTDSLYHIQAPAGGTMLLDGTVLTETSEGYVVDASQYEPGYYTLHYGVVIGEYNCLSEYETVIHFTTRTNVREFDQAISIYPNPATTTLNLGSTETMDFTATITDITGKVIRTENILSTRHAINVSDLSSGIYLLRLQTPTGATKTVKFVKR